MQNLLFLDLDGTIREPIGDHTFIQNPRDQRAIRGATEAIAHYVKRGFGCIGITNQGGVAAGKKSIDACLEEQRYTLDLFPALQKIYLCPDFQGKQLGIVQRDWWEVLTPDGYSSFRKPGAGMIEYCLATHEPSGEVWYVGDREEYELAAGAAGVNFCPADAWRNRFLPGIHEHSVTPAQVEFLEGIRLHS